MLLAGLIGRRLQSTGSLCEFVSVLHGQLNIFTDSCWKHKQAKVVFLLQFQLDSTLHMSLQSLAVNIEDNVSLPDNDGAGSATRRDATNTSVTQQDTTKAVMHHRVDLPPYFHGDGKDKESFSKWKTRLELAVKARAVGQQLNIGIILPTRLSGDALSYWLSLAPEIQQDYDGSTGKLKDVLGRKEILLQK